MVSTQSTKINSGILTTSNEQMVTISTTVLHSTCHLTVPGYSHPLQKQEVYIHFVGNICFNLNLKVGILHLVQWIFIKCICNWTNV